MRICWYLLPLAAIGCSQSSSATHAGAGGGATAGSGPQPTAIIASTPDYVGLVTALDGSGSSDSAGRALTYAWNVLSAPSGSAVTGGGSNPTFTFVGDRGGDYVVALTVTTASGASANTTATVTVPTLPVFYRQETFAAGGDSFVLGVVQSDGTGAHAVGCPVMVADKGDAGAGNKTYYGDDPEGVGTRVFYPPSTPMNVAPSAVFAQVAATGNQLLAANAGSDCTAAPPTRLDATPTVEHWVPRFSPDGSRVAWIEDGSPARLVTAGVDGSARRNVRSATTVEREPPVWLDGSTIAWVENAAPANSTPDLQIVSATDADGAGDTTRATLVDCPQATDATALGVITQFDRVGTSWIVSGGVHSRYGNPAGAIELFRLAGDSCSTTAATTLAAEPAASFAWDFAPSPDGSTLALAAIETDGTTSDIFLVPVDGSVQPSRFIGSQPGVDDIGPIWVANGKQILWTQLAADGTPTGGGLMIASRDGSHIRSLLAPSSGAGTATFVGGAVNRGLDCSASGASAASAAELALLLALFWLARRRTST
ncbi:MAG TPA: PKD domain-containing protein [Polyangia bacterium]|nr:PKD domain-containing protein [Polyangia bacterium]